MNMRSTCRCAKCPRISGSGEFECHISLCSYSAYQKVGTCSYALTVCADNLCKWGNESDGSGGFEPKPSGPLRTLSDAEVLDLRDEVKEMFYSAYSGYMTHAYPADQLKPMSCQGAFFELTAGNMLTLIDSMDMLVILGRRGGVYSCGGPRLNAC